MKSTPTLSQASLCFKILMRCWSLPLHHVNMIHRFIHAASLPGVLCWRRAAARRRSAVAIKGRNIISVNPEADWGIHTMIDWSLECPRQQSPPVKKSKHYMSYLELKKVLERKHLQKTSSCPCFSIVFWIPHRAACLHQTHTLAQIQI